MTRLLTVELRRFFARRLTRFLALGLFLGVVAAGIGMAANTSKDVAAAHQKAERVRSEFVQEQAGARQQCIATVPADEVDQACPPAEAEVPPASAFYRDPRFSFVDHVQDLLRTGAAIGGLVALLLGASIIGAEWQAGTFATLLTWEPRRVRVAAAKTGAAVLGSVAVVAVATGLLVAVAALVAGTSGTFASVVVDRRPQPHFAMQTWAMAGRVAVLIALLAATGAALALLLRHTVAALGVVLGYLIVGEAVIGSLRHGDIRHHLIQSRLAALVEGRYTWMVPVRTPDGGVEFSSDHQRVVYALPAGLELVVVVGALLLIATLVLQRRDVA